MRSQVVKIFLSAALLLSFTSAYAEAGKENNIESLSPELRTLIQGEMQAIEGAMSAILIANASGDTKKIAHLAKQIKESFVLKKNLSKEQRHELHTLLPSDFLKKDQAFHYNAGMLEHVAENNKTELIGFYYSKLFDACSDCHKTYARHRFTEFSGAMNKNKHEH